MKLITGIARIAAGWVALLAAQMVALILLPMKSPPAAQNPSAWLAASDLLAVAAIGIVAANSAWRGWKLGLALAAVPLGIGLVNLIEGAVYLTHAGINWPRMLAVTLLTYALVGPLWALVFGKGREPERGHEQLLSGLSPSRQLGKFLACDVIYLVLYLAAGIVIFPFVKSFYATQNVPPMARIVALQLLVRGPAFVAICLLPLRMMRLSRAPRALIVGLVFAILSGAAPLIIPSPFFPDAVRWVHLCEVTSSNFLFGTFVGWIWSGSKPTPGSVEQAA